ncbi:hypothetical protein [Oscillatoria nigro-viridis]|uniref:hypothetical protein n=1 Tax=Phormidium nigroviride TaxID=482564 RepID=UPI00167FB923|nr:hypothetical protein [Oscillatoria nigro-viridis]
MLLQIDTADSTFMKYTPDRSIPVGALQESKACQLKSLSLSPLVRQGLKPLPQS